MGLFRNGANRKADQAPWAGPFGPPPAAEAVTINPMVKTARELAPVAEQGHVAPVAAHIVAA